MAKNKTEPKLEVKDNDRVLVEEEMLNLKNSAGWKRLESYYDGKIKWLELQLAEGDIADIEELKLLRARRNMAIQFRNLPELIIEFVQKGEGAAPDLDPYQK